MEGFDAPLAWKLGDTDSLVSQCRGFCFLGPLVVMVCGLSASSGAVTEQGLCVPLNGKTMGALYLSHNGPVLGDVSEDFSHNGGWSHSGVSGAGTIMLFGFTCFSSSSRVVSCRRGAMCLGRAVMACGVSVERCG